MYLCVLFVYMCVCECEHLCKCVYVVVCVCVCVVEPYQGFLSVEDCFLQCHSPPCAFLLLNLNHKAALLLNTSCVASSLPFVALF